MIFIFYRDLRMEDNTALKYLLTQVDITEISFACIVDPVININKFAKETFYDIINSLSKNLNINIQLFDNMNSLNKHISARFQKYKTQAQKGKAATFTIAFNKNLIIWDKWQKQIISNYEQQCDIICKEDYTLLPERLASNKKGGFYKVYTPFYKHYLSGMKTNKSDIRVDFNVNNSSKFRDEGLQILKRVVNGDFNHYKDTRNYPSNSDGTTKLGKYISFGVVSIREVYSCIPYVNKELIREIIWRDFFYFCYDHTRMVIKKKSKKANKQMQNWSWSDAHNFIKAGIKELMETGWVNNRLRMIIVMFMIKTKDLTPEYTANWFSKYMVDYYESSNNGGIFWAIRQPSFRNFNYNLQYEKYDKNGEYTNEILSQKKLMANKS